jgi:tRNA-Thr(GGU) m(6)t(6)A37 methyltransferase TsaA
VHGARAGGDRPRRGSRELCRRHRQRRVLARLARPVQADLEQHADGLPSWPVQKEYVVRPVGRVESSLVDRAAAPRQGDEGTPDCTVAFEPTVAEALRDVVPGTELILLTWLDRAERDVLVVHPRGDTSRPPAGVFSTRSPDRPNPIGLHRVTVLAIDGARLRVRDLEALDGTPVLDVKPVLGDVADR